MIDKIPTGIAGVDELIGGGLPKGRSILLSGEPGTGKTLFSLQYLLEGAKRGESVIYVTTREGQ